MVAGKLEHVAVEQIRTGLRRHADRASSLDAVLRVLRAGLDAEFLHRVWKWQREVDAVVPVVMHGAIQEVLHAELLPSCDGDAATLSQAAARWIARVDRAAREHDERGHVASLERQCFDRFVVDDRSDRRVARLDERRGRFH